jgi:Flp pilus assembly protein TadD
MERHTEALTEIKRAKDLDPLRVSIRNAEGIILQNARRHDEAIQQFQNVIKLQPDFSEGHAYLGYAYDAKGMYAEAIAEYQKVISLEGETTTMQAYSGYALAMSGKRNEARALLDKLKTTKKYVSPAELAILYAGLGDKEAAFAALERAYAARDLQMQYLKAEPHYDSLRSDPRFTDLLRKVGLAP